MRDPYLGYIDEAEDLSEEKLKFLFSRDSNIIDEIASFNLGKKYNWFYKFLIRFLTDMEMTEESAKEHYFKILSHQEELSEKMGRDIGLRVALMDYFHNVSNLLKNPKVLEIGLYEEILKMSKEDPKTGCYNARFMNEFAAREIKRARRYNQKISIMFLDIDNFKKLNEKYGHLFADKVLKKFVEIITMCVRQEDLLGRYGGDEFIVLFPQTSKEGAMTLSDRIREKLTNYFASKEYMGEKMEVSFSGGICSFPEDGDSYDKLLAVADKALFTAKSMGKNNITCI